MISNIENYTQINRPLARALETMDVVSAATGGATIREIAGALELPRATAYRLVRSLERLGYLQGDGARSARYRPGRRFLRQHHHNVPAAPLGAGNFRSRNPPPTLGQGHPVDLDPERVFRPSFLRNVDAARGGPVPALPPTRLMRFDADHFT